MGLRTSPLQGSILVACVILLTVSGCCGDLSSLGSSSSPGEPRVTGATYAKELTSNMQAQNPTTEFLPHEKVNLSVAFAGRPRSGVVKAQFSHRDSPIAEASVDFSSQANKGLFFSIGGKTYVGFWLTHENPLLVGSGYKTDIFVNGNPAGSYPFKISPPADAVPSKVHTATLAQGMTAERLPIGPSTTFGPTDTVHLLGRLDLGRMSWVEVSWYINGQTNQNLIKSLTAHKNISNEPYFFTALPPGGWPPGQHKAVLVLDGTTLGEYPFTVVGSPPGGQAPMMPGGQPPMMPGGQPPMMPGGQPPAPGQAGGPAQNAPVPPNPY